MSRPAADLDLEPLDATFRDGGRAPLHGWFPYLEGYSPRFVRRVRETYLPDATRILEPFAGSGTTPVVLAADGVRCDWVEANPAMARVARTKLAVMDPVTDRGALATALRHLAATLEERLVDCAPDAALRHTYRSTFRGSAFFRDEALERVLRLRTLDDAVEDTPRLPVGACLTVAVLASLLPASLLKRAGDVRYRTERELARGVPDVVDTVRAALERMAADLERLAPAAAVASQVGMDARALEGREGYDGVITSPPYLNGTNYIRNARLELWYLRHLEVQEDLRALRDGVVVSGINDVRLHADPEPASAGVEEVVAGLADAYDPRIARMAAGYFADMRRVLVGLASRVRPGGRVCVDIGDSEYAGVHVPTDELLVEIAADVGFSEVDRVRLRERRSKGGAPLRQTLLVLEAPGGWPWLRTTLPHQHPPFSKRNWGNPLHSLCSYQGKLKPSLAHHLVAAFSAPGDLVVDPFSGAGTVPLEACLQGRTGVGMDLSPLGYLLTRAKVDRPDPAEVERLVGALEASLGGDEPTGTERASAAAMAFNSAIPDYFHPETLREVLLARRFFLDRWGESAAWATAMACCAHLLHGNRPYALSRRSHPLTPYRPTGPVEARPLIPRLRAKLGRSQVGWMAVEAPGLAIHGDCAQPWALPRAADAVITSPPFYDSTRFWMTNWMRTWFSGWERSDFDKGTGAFFETRQRRSMDAYGQFFARVREAVRPGAWVVLHLGHSAKCDMAAEVQARTGPGFEAVDLLYEGVEHCESHGVRDKGTVRGHAYLVLRATGR